MEKIASFQVNHLTLVPGVYVSRRDKVGSETLTTFDLRMTRPNKEPVMNTAEVHTLEHLGATVFTQSSCMEGSRHLFWTDGMQNWILSDLSW